MCTVGPINYVPRNSSAFFFVSLARRAWDDVQDLLLCDEEPARALGSLDAVCPK